GTFRMEIDDVDVTGPMQIPNTGSYQSWQDIFSPPFTLNAGPRVVKFVAISENPALTAVGNLNYFEILPASETTLLADNFDDNTFNTDEWTKSMFSGTTDPAVQVNEAAGRLEIG